MKHILIIAILVIFAGCKKDSKSNVAFYQSKLGGAPWLYVDGAKVGQLRPIDHTPSCTEIQQGHIVNMELPYGKHKFSIEGGKEQEIKVNTGCMSVQVEF